MRWGEILHPFRKRRDDALDDHAHALGLTEYFTVPRGSSLCRAQTGGEGPVRSVQFDLPRHLYREINNRKD
jgi:hypothetical protein